MKINGFEIDDNGRVNVFHVLFNVPQILVTAILVPLLVYQSNDAGVLVSRLAQLPVPECAVPLLLTLSIWGLQLPLIYFAGLNRAWSMDSDVYLKNWLVSAHEGPVFVWFMGALNYALAAGLTALVAFQYGPISNGLSQIVAWSSNSPVLLAAAAPTVIYGIAFGIPRLSRMIRIAAEKKKQEAERRKKQ